MNLMKNFISNRILKNARNYLKDSVLVYKCNNLMKRAKKKSSNDEKYKLEKIDKAMEEYKKKIKNIEFNHR